MIKVTKSPLASHAVNPNKLKVPKPQYDLTKILLPAGTLKGFEAIKDAREKDRKRTRWFAKATNPQQQTLGTWLGQTA